MKDGPNLDLLRAIAVWLVVLSHTPYFIGWGAQECKPPTDAGEFAIEAIFVICNSGMNEHRDSVLGGPA